MRRQSVILLLAGAVACAGKATVQPSPQVSRRGPRIVPTAVVAAPAPTPLDSSQVSEIARDVSLAADSAADEAVLDQLAAAHPDVPSDSASEDELPAVPVAWDIDVTTWGDHERVQFYLNFFEEQAHPRFQIWLERMPVYEPMIRQKLQAANMPTDLVYLALIESGFSNSAMSRTRAVGMWQFMPRTGREYGLRIDSWVDERRDPVKATNAALEFLSDLYQRFGSYYLAAAAYNAGGGKISRGLKRIGATPTVSTASASVAPDGAEAMTEDEEDEGFSDADFFKLYDTRHIRRETKDYVPKLIAAARIAKEPQRYGFLPTPEGIAEYPLDSLVVSGMTGLDVVAELADTSLTYIREINPQYLRLATPPGTTSVVRVPRGRQASTQAAYTALPPAERVTFAYYAAKKGDTPTKIAQHYGIPVGVIYEANPWVRSGSAVKAGRQVVVPTGGSASVVVAREVSTARESPDRGGGGGYHTVRKGETLGGIAGRYHVSTAQLKAWNHMSGTTVRVGQKLRVSPGAGRSSTQLASRDHAKGGGSTSGASATVKYKVRSGDTLSGIAKRHGVTVASIKQVNDLSGGLRSGTTIRIPKKA